MEKRSYVKPILSGEEFVPQNYIAACGDVNSVYKFECEAPGGTLFYYPESDGSIDGEYTGTKEAVKLGSYNPCHKKHEASTTDKYYDGYIRNRNWDGSYTIRKVIVWRGPNDDNGHATGNLDISSWEVAKS